MKIGFLGPRGTFTEAALSLLEDTVDYQSEPFAAVPGTLDAVRNGIVDAALVPFENSVEGSVSLTLDQLASGEPLVIVDEVALDVTFALMARPGIMIDEITHISTHPHAEAQCRTWLQAALPEVKVVPALSTAAAAEEVSDPASRFQAAIAAEVAATHYGLDVLARDIGDNNRAKTRFIVVRKPVAPSPPTGADRTTLVLYMRDNHPGALLEILTELSVRGVNLTRVESRPTRQELGDYYFSIDLEGHVLEARVGEALQGLHRICAAVRYLGSYPRHDGVLPQKRSGTSDADFAHADEWLTKIRTTGSS
ncbi:MAG: prephenate dehydratase [Actinomycetota bacterium]|jgi:prephenate dehydratase